VANKNLFIAACSRSDVKRGSSAGLILFVGLLLVALFPFLPGTACSGPIVRLRGVQKKFYFTQPPLIRVALLRNVSSSSVSVAISAPYEIRSLPGDILLERGKRLRSCPVTFASRGIAIGRRTYKVSGLRLVPLRDGRLEVAGRRYRGELHIFSGQAGLTFVNVLDMESYLAGVLGGEMPLDSFPREALRAQAIAARTYALWRMRTAGPASFDLTADQTSQVYEGMAGESSRARRILRDTRGIVLLYRGKILPAYYSSTCGGGTGSVLAVWGRREIEPLSGVPCQFCKDSKFYSWKVTIPAREIVEALSRAGYSVADVHRLLRYGAGKNGHGGWVKIFHSSGNIVIRADDFRHIVGPSRVKSTRFEVSLKGSSFIFTGRGYGHGVGMCQWGARGMARKGKKALEILAYYYPGAKPLRIYP